MNNNKPITNSLDPRYTGSDEEANDLAQAKAENREHGPSHLTPGGEGSKPPALAPALRWCPKCEHHLTANDTDCPGCSLPAPALAPAPRGPGLGATAVPRHTAHDDMGDTGIGL